MNASDAPQIGGRFESDCEHFSRNWLENATQLAQLSPKPKRSTAEAKDAERLIEAARIARQIFLARHATAVYRELTNNFRRFVRVEDLVIEAAVLVPGLVPSEADLAREVGVLQRDKEGAEIDQGLLLAAILADERCGMHLCHAMLLPRREAVEHSREFARTGRLDLGAATIERRGKAAYVTLRNTRFLNAEDESTLDAQEIAIDVATYDLESDIAVLRGAPVEHPKWAGKRVFNAGINLTQLYRGGISFVWYLKRDLGLVNKIFRGLAEINRSPDELVGGTMEKPWLAVVDSFAIGGGCQLLLAMDYVLAASDAYMTLPARKEGIIPGAANLRLPRFTGDRIARQAILSGRRLDCASPEGRLICDEVVAPADMDSAVERIVADFTDSGVVSAAGNRRALRVAEEPLDLFRRYMAVYAREQAYCHFSPALIANLERYWNAASRKI